jgi:uncharacterized protein
LLHSLQMKLHFINREQELRELDAAETTGGLVVVFGRRRVGKTRLLVHWLQKKLSRSLYSQAIEANPEIQIDQVFKDIKPLLHTNIVPKTWDEFFELLALSKERFVLCLDEFPYLVQSDLSLPSVLQRWLDHKIPEGCLVILSGSSNRMMHQLTLNRAAPLYGRARKLLHVEPMSYGAFCKACKLDVAKIESLRKFSLVGGIPKYWEFVGQKVSSIALAQELFFGFSSYLEEEPLRILKDEGLGGANPLAVLEAVGRGAHRPSEIGARLNTAQTNLSRVFEQLIDASLLKREIPFGESVRSTKKILYKIDDPTLRFWFSVFSPHRTRWYNYSTGEKQKLVHDHASTVFEDLVRGRYPGSAPYWEGDVEFDVVREASSLSKEEEQEGARSLFIGEAKLKVLNAAERKSVLKRLAEVFQRCNLGRRYSAVRFEVFDATLLKAIGG